MSLSRGAFSSGDGRGPAVPAGLLIVPVVLLLIGSLGVDIGYAALSSLVLVLGLVMLWRPGEAPILLLVFSLAWVGASASIFHSIWLGEPVRQYAAFGSDMDTAVVLSLLGVFALACGMRLGAGRQKPLIAPLARELALKKPVEEWFKLYIAATVAAFFANGAIWMLPSIAQLLIGVAQVKWAFYFMFAYAVLVRSGSGRALLGAAILVELAQGIGGFFSDFKTVLLVTILAIGASGAKLRMGTTLSAVVLFVLLIGIGITWTAVKMPYRQFVSGGAATQAVTVDTETRLAKLWELVGAVDGAAFGKATDDLLRRLSYVEFFGATLNYVPLFEPHTHGAIIADAAIRPFTPRFLFPDKAVIDDTERSNQYTGGLAGTSEATSISLGYIAECYIDFGFLGMIPALVGIGFFYGYLYRWLVETPYGSPLVGMAMASATLVTVGTLDNSFTKIFGGVIATSLVASVFLIWVIPSWYPWLKGVRR